VTPEAVDRSVTAVVLCGGGSRRLGTDKTAAALGPTTVLDHLLDTLPASWAVVAVGPERPTTRPVCWTRETPPGGGPVAAVAAASALVTSDVVVVLAGDQPFAAGAATRLAADLRADPAVEAVVGEISGQPNPLLAAYRTTALRAALPIPPDHAPARTLLAVAHRNLPVTAEDGMDVDTPEALAAARHRLGP
jgi:molybdopterin-guanine dinucleotide biosynthesis protein A